MQKVPNQKGSQVGAGLKKTLLKSRQYLNEQSNTEILHEDQNNNEEPSLNSSPSEGDKGVVNLVSSPTIISKRSLDSHSQNNNGVVYETNESDAEEAGENAKNEYQLPEDSTPPASGDTVQAS